MSVMSPSLSNDSTFRPTLLSDYFFRDDDDDESMYPEEHHNNGSMSCRSTSCHAMDCDRSPSSRGGDRDSSNVSTPTTTSPTLGMPPPPPQTYASPVKTVLTPTGDTEEYVGPFKLGPVLGVGCTGTVRLGVHKDTGFEAAFKIIEKKYLNTDPKLWKKVKREIVILKVIEHPHVLKLYDVLETVNRLYLVLEHVRGGELFDYIVSRGRLERYEALKLTAQIVQGLEHCHAHSICHRDLKPENLLLDENHNIKIADFGMAQLMKKDNMRKTSCGSPHYASPEVIEGGAYDAKLADIWSIGVILYALLTGSLPFDHDSIPILLAMVSRGQYTIPSQVPADCADLIRRMLVVDPTKRITLSQIRHHPCYRGTDFFPPEIPQSITNAAAAATVAALGTTTPSPPSSGASSPATASTPGSQLQARRSLKLDTQEVDERVLLDLESLGLGWGTRDELRRKISLFAKRRSQADSSSSQEEEEPPIEHVFYQRLLQRRMDRLAELSRLSPKPRPRTIGARASSSLSISTSSANSITLPPAAATPPLQRSFTDGAHMQPHHEHESFSPLTSPTNPSAQPVTYQSSQSTSHHHHHKKHHSVQAASAPQGPTTASHHPSPLSLPVPPPITQNSTSPLASPTSGGTMPPFHQLLSPMATPMCSPPMSPTIATPFAELPSPAANIMTHHEHHISISANSTSTSTSTSAPPSASTSAPSSCKQSSRRLFSSGASTSSTNGVDTNTSLVSRAIHNKRISIPSVTNPLISPRADLAAKGLTNVVPSPTSKATPTYMESPRFHRKKLRQQPDSIDQSSVKKSWFSAIFSARPSMNIMSTLTGRKPLTPRSQAAAIAASTTSSTPSPPTLNTTLASHVVTVPPHPHKSTPSVSPPVPLLSIPTPSSPTARHHDLSSTLYSDKSIPSLIDQLKHVFSELHLNYIMKSKYVFDVENHIHSNISSPGIGTSPPGSQRSIHSSQPSSTSSSAVMSATTTPVASTRPRLSSTDLTVAIHEENEEALSSNHLTPYPRRRSSGADVTTNHSPTSHAVNALAGGIDAIRISLGEPAMALSPHAPHHARLTIQLGEPTSTSPASIQFISRQGEPQAVRALQYAIQKALNL